MEWGDHIADAVHDAKRLEELRALPLERKIQISQTRIIEWYNHYRGNVVVSFSGGKDSTVLLHLVRSVFPNVKAVFSNTGLEYPEIQRHVMSVDNVDIVRPSMRFDEVISTYGYPLIGKEVAEAIYYARRIRSQSCNVERERERQKNIERKRQELLGRRIVTQRLQNRGGGWNDLPSQTETRHARQQKNHLIETGTARNRRTVLSGMMKSEGEDHRHQENGEITTGDASIQMNVIQKTKIASRINQKKQAGKTGVGGVFSNPKEQFGTKSLFNKEKWLPMVYTPYMISHYCCFKMKKSPMKKYQHERGLYPILGTLAEESRVRKQAWIRHGCNAFESSSPTSQPLSFWTEQDILAYIVKYDLPIASVYGDIMSVHDGAEYPAKDMCGSIGYNLKCTGCDRTGCIFCGFGFHLEKKGKTRFQRLAETHPKQYEYSIGGGQWVDNPHYDATAPEYDGEWKNWNPKKIWVPSKKGLGMGKVFDMANEIYGKDFYRYE